MKLTKTFKRFWTMQKQTGGFTLVELIVVIAILAILAGVAIPAYSGYITKANEAADQQLLSAINRAFSATCIQNGYGSESVTAAVYDSTNHALVSVKVGASALTAAELADFNADYMVYFSGNENTSFKVFGIEFDAGKHMFVQGGSVKALVIGNKTYYVSQNAIDNFQGSVFADNVDTMQDQVNVLAGTYGSLVGGFNEDALKQVFGEDYVKYLEEQGATSGTAKGNATVLYIAQQTQGMTAEDAMSTLCNAAFYLNQQTSSGQTPGLMDMLEAANSTGDTLTTAAMMYGAVTAYANGSDNAALKTQAANVNDADSLMALFSAASADQGFLDYCGTYQYDASGVTSSTPSDAFVKDMNGYLGALEGMNSMSGGLNIEDENLWSGDDMDGLLGEMLGG